MKFLHRFRPKKAHTPVSFSLVDIGRDTVKAVVVLVIPGTSEPQVIGYGLAETGGHDVTGGRLGAAAVTNPVNIALTQADLRTALRVIQTFGRIEGLDAHARSAALRFRKRPSRGTRTGARRPVRRK